jgi:hypothetical protein
MGSRLRSLAGENCFFIIEMRGLREPSPLSCHTMRRTIRPCFLHQLAAFSYVRSQREMI